VNRLLEMCGAWFRITSVVAVLFFVAPLAVGAQPAGKVHRIGFLGNSTAALEADLVGPFREGLREFGYVEGQSIAIEYRWAEGKYERFPGLIAELLAVPAAPAVDVPGQRLSVTHYVAMTKAHGRGDHR
jgi:hypothetical protein